MKLEGTTGCRQGGFTLLETLVALAVVALLALLIGEATGFGIDSVRRLSARAEVSGIEAGMHSDMRRLLARTLPVPDPERPALRFQGDGRLVRFVAPGPRGIQDHALEIDASGSLVLSRRGVEAKRYDMGWTDAGFSYYGGSPAIWSEAWRDRTSLPELIRLSGPGLAPFVVRLRVEGGR